MMNGVSLLALERGGTIANFMDDFSQAFCLVSVPDYQPRCRQIEMKNDIHQNLLYQFLLLLITMNL